MPRWRNENVGDIAFADVAMAMLGPIAFLMVLFMVIAGRADPTSCQPLDSTELRRRGEALQLWFLDLVQANETIAATLPPTCAVSGAVSLPPIIRQRPPPFDAMCRRDEPALFAAAGLTQADVDAQIARRDALLARAVQCLGAAVATTCIRPQAEQRKALAVELRAFTGGQDDEIAAMADELERLGCANPKSTKETVKGAGAASASLPSSLIGLCPQDIDGLFAEAGVTRDILARGQAERHRLAAQWRRCVATQVPAQTEHIDVRSSEINFRRCSTEFIVDCRFSDADAYFLDLAGRVAKKLHSGQFNRIDIFGHTDNRRVAGNCGKAADNAELASLRALAFRNALQRALESSGEFSGIVDALHNNALRIYAIGVGEAEPIIAGAQHESEHQVNRRIELRFAADQRRGPAQ